jgi:O-antigen/teichoic acid export membrane protein
MSAQRPASPRELGLADRSGQEDRWPSAVRRLASGLRGEHGRDVLWALTDQGTILLSSALSFLLVGRALGAVGYGAFVGLYGLMGPFTALGQSGVYLAAMEHVARKGEPPAEVARSCMSITIGNAAVWVPLLSIASLLWIRGLPPLAAVLILTTEFCLNGLLSQSVGIVQVLSGYPAAARLRIVNALLRIVPLATLGAAGSLTLSTLALSQALTVGTVMTLAVRRTSRLAGVALRPGPIRMRHVRSVLLYGTQIGASNVQTDGDKFVLNLAHHQADAGRYGAASRIMTFALLPVFALVNATHVSFLRAVQHAERPMQRAVLSSLGALVYSVPAALCLLVVAPVVPKVLTKDFTETTAMLQWLAALVIVRGQPSFPMNGLMGLGRNGLRTHLALGCALLTLVLYAALIPAHSWRGALAASIVGDLSLAASGWVGLYRCQREHARSEQPRFARSDRS